jgi:hypothetical protein
LASKKINYFIFSILFAQVLFALAIAPLVHKENIFPFHRWALFSRIQNKIRYPLVYIIKADSELFSPPIEIHDFFKKRKYVDFLVGMDNVQAWLSLTLENKNSEALILQNTFEQHFFKHYKNITYEIRYDLIDQVDFMRKRTIIESGTLWGPFDYQGNRL